MENLRAELELLRAESRDNFRLVHERLDRNDERVDALTTTIVEQLTESRAEMKGVRDHLDRVGDVFDRAMGAMIEGFTHGQQQLDDHESRIRALERRLAS